MLPTPSLRSAVLGLAVTSLMACGDGGPTAAESEPDPEEVRATGRWVSSRPLWSGTDTADLTFDIDSVDQPGDNGRAFWNFLVERIVSASYDATPRRLEFMVVSSSGGVEIVTGRLSPDGRSMLARFAGAPTFGGARLQGLVGDTLTFNR